MRGVRGGHARAMDACGASDPGDVESDAERRCQGQHVLPAAGGNTYDCSGSDPGDVDSDADRKCQAAPPAVDSRASKQRMRQGAKPKPAKEKSPRAKRKPKSRGGNRAKKQPCLAKDPGSDTGSVTSNHAVQVPAGEVAFSGAMAKPAIGGQFAQATKPGIKVVTPAGGGNHGPPTTGGQKDQLLDRKTLTRDAEPDIPNAAWDAAKKYGTAPLAAAAGLRLIMEIFAGCCRLSGACAERGLNIFVPIERNLGPWSNISDMAVQAAILTALMSGAVWYVHLATPCTPWSRARTTSKAPPALDVIWFTAKILRCCRDRKIMFSLENPAGSGLFDVPVIAEELLALKAFRVQYECCAWGASYQKPSELRTNVEALRALGRRCKAWLPSAVRQTSWKTVTSCA